MKLRVLAASTLSLALVACATGGQDYRQPQPYGQGYSQPQRCFDCGVVERIETVYAARDNSRTGAILGGIVGAVAGRAISDSTGGSKGNQNVATVIGAAGGAVAGNAIENKRNEETYDIYVRMDDGRRLVINQNGLGNGLRPGSYVRVNNGRISILR